MDNPEPIFILNPQNQLLQTWIDAAREGHFALTYTGFINLSNVTKVLIGQNEMEPLLMLARHPNVPIASLHRKFSRLAERALDAYIFLTSLVQSPNYSIVTSSIARCTDIAFSWEK